MSVVVVVGAGKIGQAIGSMTRVFMREHKHE
jgi:hypothetical protein